MKAMRVMGLLAVLSMLLIAVPAASAAGPTGNWVSGISCQNMGSAPAMLSVSFYPENNGTAALTYTDPITVPVNGFRGYYTPNSFPTLPTGFLGSGVVSSDQQVACNINTQTSGTGTAAAPYRMGTAGGVAAEQAAPKLYVPQVMRNLGSNQDVFSSYVAVQNTESAAVAVTVSYKDRNGVAVPAATEHFTIPGQSNKVFYQADNTNLPAGFLGSAIVSSDDGTSKLAAVVNLYNLGSTNTNDQLLSYNAVASGGQKLYVPRIVRNYAGYQGGLTIQNISDSIATSVKITFTFASTPFNYTSGSIAPGAALALYMPNVPELSGVDNLPANLHFGSAVIESTAAGANIVAIVNEDNRGGAGVPSERVGQGGTYNAPVVGSETTTVLFPQFTRKAGGVFSGGLQVANTTNTAGTCDISFASAPGANETAVPLPASGVISQYGPNINNLPDGYNSAVTVVCTQPVIGIVNLSVSLGSGKFGDSSTVTTGINR